MVEIIGYIATALVVLSFAMKDLKWLRVINMIGCAVWIAYGLMLDSMPIVITNAGIMLINMGHIVKSLTKKVG